MCSSWVKSTFDQKKKWGSQLETFSFSGKKQKLPWQCGFIRDFRMWTQVCWRYVTLSQNTSKGWKSRNIWKRGLEEQELHSYLAPYIYIFFNRRLTDIWKMGAYATDWRLIGIYGQYKALFAPHPNPHPSSLWIKLDQL